MKAVHKKAFQELREWCEKYNASLEADISILIRDQNKACEFTTDYICKDEFEVVDGNNKVFNFMEKKDDKK